jgi:RimJ/RimL family protein N-acetyltransferase
MKVRRLRPDEHELLRALRLRALGEEPDAFGSTYAREAAFTVAVWQDRLRPGGNPNIVCEADDGALLGIAGGVRDDRDGNVADLVGMWVDPVARGSGAADALVAEVISWAHQARITTLRLHYTEGNARARSLYERHGFRATGRTFLRERDGMNEIEMERADP